MLFKNGSKSQSEGVTNFQEMEEAVSKSETEG